jgi:hypothetical protein
MTRIPDFLPTHRAPIGIFGAPACVPAGATLAHAAPPEPVVTALMHKALSDAHGFVHVLEGSIVMGVEGGKEKTLHAGETFYEGPRDVKPALIPVAHR